MGDGNWSQETHSAGRRVRMAAVFWGGRAWLGWHILLATLVAASAGPAKAAVDSRSKRSLWQEEQLDLFFNTTAGWSSDVPEWKRYKWCDPQMLQLEFTPEHCEVRALTLFYEPNIAGSLPDTFFPAFEHSLTSLTLYNMTRLNGTCLLRQLSESGVAAQLQTLQLSGTALNSTIPPDMEVARGSEVGMQECLLHGPIPHQMYKASNLNLSKNNLEGEVFPRSLFDKPARLILNDNRLSGRLNMYMLARVTERISLHHNGPLVPATIDRLHSAPTEFLAEHISFDSVDLSLYGNDWARRQRGFLWCSFPNIKVLLVRNAGLTGEMPPDLASRCLQEIDVSNNSLSGVIPVVDHSDCHEQLFRIRLENNQLAGHFDDSWIAKLEDGQDPFDCSIEGNLFLCPLGPRVAGNCTGGCVGTCYNNGIIRERGRPCECPPGFRGTQCEVVMMPGRTPPLNCTMPADQQELVMCAPTPAECDVCRPEWSDRLCSALDIAAGACVHGRCVRLAGGSYACECDPWFSGGRCDTAVYVWIYALGVLMLILTVVACVACTMIGAAWIQRRRLLAAKAQKDSRIAELQESLLLASREEASAELDLDTVSVDRVLGEGASARVFAVTWQGRRAVLKQFRDELDSGGYTAEKNVFESLRHPNIVSYWGFVASPPCILMEYCDGGSLYDALRREGDATLATVGEILMCGLDIARGVGFLHGRGLVHRDIKSQNILLDRGRPKVADFDTARRVSQAGTMTLNTGTVRWMAPEVCRSKWPRQGEYGPAVDVWSWACVLWGMFARDVPFSHLEWTAEIMDAVSNGETPLTKGCGCPGDERTAGCSYYLHVPPPVRALLLRCWSCQPDARPSASAVQATVEAILSGAY